MTGHGPAPLWASLLDQGGLLRRGFRVVTDVGRLVSMWGPLE